MLSSITNSKKQAKKNQRTYNCLWMRWKKGE